jgi:hypothetical protein
LQARDRSLGKRSGRAAAHCPLTPLNECWPSLFEGAVLTCLQMELMQLQGR